MNLNQIQAVTQTNSPVMMENVSVRRKYVMKIVTVVMAVTRMDVVSHEYMCDCTYYVGLWQ